MKQSGELNLIPFDKGLKTNKNHVSIQRGPWICSVGPRQGITNGASIPWPICYLFGGRLNQDFDESAFWHDLLVGEFQDRVPVRHVLTGYERDLTWDEAASWFYDLLKCEDRKANGKLRRKLFYHAVMMLRRLRVRK